MRELDVFPLPGGTYRKSSSYGTRVNPVTGKAGTFHRGVDYAAGAGTPVYAPFDGQLTTGYEKGGAGNWTNLTNGSDVFKSFHHIRPGRTGWVTAGEEIAQIGTTGSSTGAHGHFELWENGRVIDPTGFLVRAPLKGSAHTPTVIPEDDEDMASFIASSDQSTYEVWGIFARPIDQDMLNTLKFFGVPDKGKLPDNFWRTKTVVPSGSMTGAPFKNDSER